MIHYWYRYVLLVAAFVGVLCCGEKTSAQSQYVDSFYVSFVEKTEMHPYFGIGYEKGFSVNGIEGDTLILVRNKLYIFNIQSTYSETYFQFYSIPIGGTQGVINDQMVEKYKTSEGLWIVMPTEETIDTVYYASADVPWTGGTILIVDSLPTSVDEEHKHIATGKSRAVPNPCTDATTIRFSLERAATVEMELFDQLGRSVERQDPSWYESGDQAMVILTRDLVPGVYNYRITANGGDKPQILTGQLHVLR